MLLVKTAYCNFQVTKTPILNETNETGHNKTIISSDSDNNPLLFYV